MCDVVHLAYSHPYESYSSSTTTFLHRSLCASLPPSCRSLFPHSSHHSCTQSIDIPSALAACC